MQAETFYGQIVGQVIRGRRELQGCNVATMAESVQMASASGWSRVETGDTTITVSQLRKAARKLEMEPWELLHQADVISTQIESSGVTVHDEKPKNVGKWLLGGAAILALVAGAAAAVKKTQNTEEEE